MNLFKKLILAAGLCLVASLAHAQNTRYDNIVLNQNGHPIVNASVYVCGVSGTGIPCSPLTTVYSDAAGNFPITQPIKTGPIGNYGFYAPAGSYVFSVSAPNVTPMTGPITLACLPGSACIATNALDCSTYVGADVGAKWNACQAAAPIGAVITFKNFTSPQVLTTPVNITNGVWSDMAGLQITQQAGITVSTSAVIDKGEFDQGFNGDQFTVTASGVSIQNNTINGDDGTHTGRGIVINAGTSNTTLDTNTIGFHSAAEIQDAGGSSFAPNTIKNSRIFFDGVAGIISTGGENISDTQFNWSGTGAGNAILQPSVAFYSLLRMDHVTFNGNQAAAMISAPNGADIILTNSQSTANGGYPAIDAPNGGLLQVSWNSLQGGGANGPLIRYNTLINAGSALDISHNYNLSAINGATVIEASVSQGAKIDANDSITSDFSGKTGGCAVKIEGALGGSVSDNGISVVGYSAFIGPNYGICFKTVAAQHNDNLFIHHNTVTGQSSSGANSIGMIFDNSANVAPDFADGNIWDSNFCIDLGTCITRVSPTWNNLNTYSNNAGVALGKVYDTTGSTNDVVTGFNVAFANLPVAGNSSFGYCSDCTQTVPVAGGGSGAEVFRINSQWAGLGGLLTTATFAGLQPGTNSVAGGFIASGNTWDFHLAAHTLTFVTGTNAGKPATCTVGELYFASDLTAGQNILECDTTNVWTQQLNSGAAGASTALSNLAAVAINATLLPASANTVALGSNTLPFTNVFLSVAASKTLSFASLANLTANRTITAVDANTVLVQPIAAVSHQFATAISSTTGAVTLLQPTLADIAAGAAPAGLFDFTAGTFKLPVAAGFTVTANGNIGYDSTNKNWHAWQNGADHLVGVFDGSQVNGDCVISLIAASVVNLADGGGCVTGASVTTFTNKILKAEATGNTLGVPVSLLYNSAGCNASAFAPALDIPTSNGAVAQCAGTTARKGVLTFARGNIATINSHLPKDWDSTASTDLEVLLTTADTTNGHVISFNVQTGCNAVSTGAVTDDPALNALQALSITIGASQVAGGEVSGTLSGMTMTGCSADSNFEVVLTRNNSGTDTATSDVTGLALKQAVITIGTLKNATNR